MKDIENEIKEKYDEVEVPSYMFDTSRVFKRVEEEKRNKRNLLLRIVAGIGVLAFIATFIVITLINGADRKIKTETIIKSNKVEGNIDISQITSLVDNIEPQDIVEIKVEKIEDYIIENGVPYTKVKAKVIKSYYDNIKDKIDLYVQGGVFSAKDIKEKIINNNEVNKYNDEDLIQVTYHNEIFIPIAEEEKTYIATIVDINGNYYVDISKAYGFKEYDPETNIVKDDMGDVELDIDQYLDSIKVK